MSVEPSQESSNDIAWETAFLSLSADIDVIRTLLAEGKQEKALQVANEAAERYTNSEATDNEQPTNLTNPQ